MTAAFVIGHPVAHSRSPLIHGHWLAEHGIAGSYRRIDVAPAALAEFLRDVPHLGFKGGNVTVPHKEAVASLVDELSPEARRLGSVNTLHVRPDGRLFGHSTDGLGFVASLDEALGPGWARARGRAVVVGAGGAARAIVAALLDWKAGGVTVVNRSLERAEALRALAPKRVQVRPWDDMEAALAGASLLVNATTLGMPGQPPLTPDLAALPRTAAVADIVYVPAETPLLAAARARGLRTVGGLGMLLHQAVPGFELWFGVRPEVTAALRARLKADIAGAA